MYMKKIDSLQPREECWAPQVVPSGHKGSLISKTNSDVENWNKIEIKVETFSAGFGLDVLLETKISFEWQKFWEK